jgi:hypothetical protein
VLYQLSYTPKAILDPEIKSVLNFRDARKRRWPSARGRLLLPQPRGLCKKNHRDTRTCSPTPRTAGLTIRVPGSIRPETAMPCVITIRQSPSISRALILEARAARTCSLGGSIRARVVAALARVRASVALDVIAK